MSVRAAATTGVEVHLLGPLEVVVGGRAVSVTGARQRALLAVLALHANEVVSRDRLIDAAWGDSPPETVQASLNVAVSKLRRALGSDVLETRAPGYVLRLAEDALDLRRFEALVGRGRRALESGDADRASALLRDALALWRGTPLSDFAYDTFAQTEIARLEELRLVALEQRIEADLARGRHSVLVGELEALVAEHPWRERLRAQLMLALYRSGRQREALDAYKEARRAFVEELAIEPSPELQRLEQAILRQDPTLEVAPSDVPVRTPAPPRAPVPAPRRRRLALAAALLALAAAAAAVIVALFSGSTPVRVTANGVGVVDPAGNELVASVRAGDTPASIAVGAGAVWVANLGERTISRIDPQSRAEVRRIGTGAADGGLATGAGSVWALDRERGTLLHIDPKLNARVGELDIRSRRPGADPVALAFGERSLWVELGHGGVLRIAPERNRVRDSLPAVGNGGALAVGFGSVWVPSVLPNEVRRVDVRTKRVTSIPFERAPKAIAAGAGAVWVAVLSADEIWRIDPHTNAVTRTIQVGDGPSAIAVGRGAVWVANSLDGTVTRVDPVRNVVVATIDVGHRPSAIAVGAGAVWVAVRHE